MEPSHDLSKAAVNSVSIISSLNSPSKGFLSKINKLPMSSESRISVSKSLQTASPIRKRITLPSKKKQSQIRKTASRESTCRYKQRNQGHKMGSRITSKSDRHDTTRHNTIRHDTTDQGQCCHTSRCVIHIINNKETSPHSVTYHGGEQRCAVISTPDSSGR